jgi:hypothetical protein
LQEGERLQVAPPQKLRQLRALRDEHQAWGGYPPVWQRKGVSERLNWLKDYRRTYLERDIAEVGQVANIDTFALAQKLLCARTANLLSISAVANDLGVAVNTVKRYLELLTMSFQCFLLPPWHENTGKRLVKSPKLFFADAGLNRAILGEVSISRGAAYENWVFAELLKWKQLQDFEPELYFYRTSAGMEVNFLIAGERGSSPSRPNHPSGSPRPTAAAWWLFYPSTGRPPGLAWWSTPETIWSRSGRGSGGCRTGISSGRWKTRKGRPCFIDLRINRVMFALSECTSHTPDTGGRYWPRKMSRQACGAGWTIFRTVTGEK